MKMQITASNPLAAHSLWTTLVSLADHTVEGCACGAAGIFPYTLVHYKSERIDHITINASNADFRITRSIDVDDNTTKYMAQKRGYVGDVIKNVMGWVGRSSIDATEFLAGLIEFVQTYSTPDGARIREQLSQAEAESIRANVSKAAFYKVLVDHESNRLDLRDFFKQQFRFADDLEQIVIERLPRIDAGIYTYASLNGKGSADTLVVKAPSGEVATIFVADGKYVLRSSCKKLVELVKLTGGIDAEFITSLVDTDSIIHGLLNQVTVE